jgi:hypothetical protein
MRYPYEDLDDSAFERIVVQCMRKLFGPGVQSFAAGPDGGRDARFQGTAERFPSAASPWSGLTVGQAKHTLAINAHYSEPDFSSTAPTSILSKEIKRLKQDVSRGCVGAWTGRASVGSRERTASNAGSAKLRALT